MCAGETLCWLAKFKMAFQACCCVAGAVHFSQKRGKTDNRDGNEGGGGGMKEGKWKTTQYLYGQPIKERKLHDHVCALQVIDDCFVDDVKEHLGSSLASTNSVRRSNVKAGVSYICKGYIALC